jgi:antitoxin component YwqK of YwqJK toxin-antitoxin module
VKHLLITIVALLMVGCGCGDSGSGGSESNQSFAETPPVKSPEVPKIDFDDTKILDQIIAKAIGWTKLQRRGKKGEELLYRMNKPKPYTGWTKWMYGNGQIKFLTQRKDGKEDGLQMWWYKNGKKNGERTYKDGQKHGLATFWYENGKKRQEFTFKYGKDISGKKWDEDGKRTK